MNEISVPVKLQIQNLQSLMSDLQGKLSNLKVGSTGFKNLQSVISAIGNEIDRLQVQTSKPFMSEAQFKTAERSVEKLEDQIEKLGLSVSRIKFSDLNLTPQQQSDIKGFEDQLESIKANLKMVKDTAKQEFLKTDLGQQWATIDSTAFSKSLSQITANIRSEVKKQQDELNKLQETATSYQNAITQNNKINEFLKKTNKDPISVGSMGEDLYNQLFDKLKRLKGGKNGGRKLIEEWLKNELELSPEIISKLVKNLHGEDLSAQLTAALQKMMKDNSAVIKANPTAEVDFKQKEQEVQNLINILREAGVSEQGIAVAEQALRQQLDSTKQSFNEYQQAAARAAQEHMNIDSTAAVFKSQLTSLRSTLDQTNAKFLQMQRTTQSFNQMKMAITNFMGFNQVLNITKNAVREAMNHIKELDSVMNGISIVTDMTTDDLWKQVDAYSEMAQNYGVSIKGAYEVSQIYYQQGLETNDVLTLTNETLKLAKISGLDYAQTTDYMTTALRGFKMEMSDASTIVDVYSNLAANTAVSQEELAVAMSKTASSMESVGSTFEDTSAMIATMVAVTRESATNIGSAMKSIASRYGELTKDPTKLVDADGEAMAFNKVDSALQSVGISMKTVDGQFRSFTEVIVELAEKWDQLESTQQRYIATQFAGNRQQSRFLALVSNKDILKANMEFANNSEDVGTLQALKALDSIEAKTEQVRVAYQQFYTTIGMQDVWKAFLDGTKNVINTLNSLPKLFNSIPIGAVAAIANTISLVKTLLNAGLNILANNFKNLLSDSFNQAEQSSKDGGIKVGRSWWQSVIQEIRTGKPAIQAEMSEAMNPTNQQNTTPNMSNTVNNSASGKFTNFVKALGNSGTKLHGIMTGLSSVLTTVGMVIKKDTVEGQKLAGTITSIGGTLQGLTGIARVAMNPADLGGWLQAAQGVMNLVNGIGLAWETAEEKLERLNKEAEELSNEAKEAKANYNILDRSVKKLNELKDKQYESEEAAEEYKSVMNEIAEKYPELIQGFDEVGNAIIDVDDAERRLADARRETAKATYEALEKERQAQKQSLDNQKEIIQGKAIKDSSSLIQANKQVTIQNIVDDNISAKGLGENFENYLKSWYLNTDFNKSAIMENDNQILVNFLNDPSTFVSEELFNALDGINTYSELKTYFESLPEHIKNWFETTNSGLTELLSKYGIGKDLEIDTSSFDIVASFLESLSTFNGSEEDIEKFKLFKINYNKLSNEQKDLLGLTDTWVEGLTEQIQTYLQESNKYASTDKLTIQSWLKYEQAEEKGYDWINTSSYSLILLSEKLSELAEDKGYESVDAFMEGEDAAKDIVEAYSDFYNSLNETQKEIYEKYLKDNSSYTEEDLWKRLGETADSSKNWSEPSSKVKEIVEKGIESTKQSKEKIKAYYEGITEPLRQTENLYNAIKSSDSNISSEYSQLMIQALEEVQATENTELATSLSNAYQKLFEEINKATPEIRNIIIDTILSGNLLTKEGILDILSKLKQTSPEAASHVEKYLNQISDLRKTNIVSLSQALLADAEEEVEKTGKLLSKANKQMSGKEAASFIDYINGLGLTDKGGNLITIDYGDFDPDASGKLAVKDQVLIDLQNAFEESLFGRLDVVNDAIEKYENLFSQDENTKQISLIEGTISNLKGQEIDSVENLIDFLESNDIALDGLINDQRIITAEGAKIIQQKAQEVVNSYNNTVKAYGLLFNSFIQDSRWAQGIYEFDGKKYGRKELIKLANDNFIPKEEIDARGAKEYINSHYNTFITDVLKKGFENINMADYEGLYEPDKIKKDLSGSYVEFINKYGDFLGLSIEELNDLIGEAIEKDKAPLDGAARKALEKVDFYKDINGSLKGVADYETIQGLADALQVSVNDLLGNYIRQLDQYEIKSDNHKLTSALNRNTELIADSINSVFNSITKYINSGLEGKLQIKDRNNFIAQLKELGITGIDKIDFTETQNGLKLSQQAAIHLYNELEKIDNIQGKIVFNDLSKELQKSNEHYKNISEILAHIKELEEAIKKAESSGNPARANQYKEELALAKEIAAVRAGTDSDAFDFMNNKLPTGFDAPINYWNSWSKAFKAINSAVKDAQDRGKQIAEATDPSTLDNATKLMGSNVYLDIQDFYNIVNEMSNIAKISGNKLTFLGKELNGDMQSATDLITEGLGYLSNIDGEGVKIDLSRFGMNLATGADAMGGNVKDAINSIARSQIEMLDGMIALLETVVQMEKLGDIDVDSNNILSIGEIFEVDEKGVTQFKDNFEKVRSEIKTVFDSNEQLKPLLTNLKISGVTLEDLFTKSVVELEKAGISQQQFANLMTALYQLSINDEYDPESWISSIKEVFAASGQVFSYFDEVTGKEFTIDMNGNSYTIDWNKKDEVDKIREAFKKAGLTDAGTMKPEDMRALLERVRNDKQQNILELVAYDLTYKLISEVDVDGKTKYKTKNGNIYDTAVEAAAALIKEEAKGTRQSKEKIKPFGTESYKLEAGFEYDITITPEGKITYSSDGIESDTYQGLIDQLLEKEVKTNSAERYGGKTSFSELTTEEQIQAKRNIHIEVTPTVEVIDEENVKKATHEQIVALANALSSGEGIVEAAKNVGIKVNVEEELTEADRQKIAELAGIESKTVTMDISANFNGENAANLEKILGDTPIKVTVNIKKGTDETGLFSSEENDEDTTPSRNVEVSINVAGDYSTILTQNTDGSYTLLTSDAKPVTINTLAEIPVELTGNPANGYTIKTCDGAIIKVPAGLGTITNLIGDATSGYTIKTQDGVIVKVPAQLSTVTNLIGDSTNGYTVITKEGAPVKVPAQLDTVTSLIGDATSGYTIKTKEGAIITVPAGLGTITSLTGDATSGYTIRTKEGATINVPAELGTTTNLIGNSTTGFTIFTTSGKVINVPAELGTTTGLIGDSTNGYTIRTIAGAEIIVPASLGTPIGLIGDATNGYTIFTIDGQKIEVPVEAGTPVGLIGDSTNGYTIRTTTGAEINIPISNPSIPSELTGDSTTGYTVRTKTADTISIPTSADMSGFYTDVDQAPAPTKIIHTITVSDVLNSDSPASKDLSSIGIDPGVYFTVQTTMPELTQKINVQYELTGDSEEYARQVQEIYDFIIAQENDEIIIDLQTKFTNSKGTEEDYQEYVNGITSRFKQLWAQQHVEVEPLELPAEVDDEQLIKEVDEAVNIAQKAADGKEVEITTIATENKETKETKTISVDASSISSSGINSQLSTLSSNTQVATDKAKELTSSLEKIDSTEINTIPFETMKTSLEGALSAANQLLGVAWNSLAAAFSSFTPSVSTTQQSNNSESPEISEPQAMVLKIDADSKLAEKKLKDIEKLIKETTAIMGIGAEDRGASSAANGIRNLINQMWAYINVSIHDDNAKGFIGEIQSALDQLVNGGPYKVSVEATVTESGGGVGATGNIALSTGNAQARGTLMGELGPELVVSGGRYFVVGQSGPEFVNLDPDAIVFNHLQTAQLLKHGMSSTRGRAMTNERVATAYATGNVEGPAMASASAALAALKQIRAMWESMISASLADLGQLAGSGTKGGKKNGGGGGGGSNQKQKNTIDPGFIADLERWYNLLRQIEKLEKDINYQEQLRNKIQSDRVINGRAYYESQKKDLKNIDEEIIRRQQLATLQKDYYDKRRQDLEQTNYGKIFTFNEEGLMQYNDQAYMPNGDKGGLFALAKLNAQNPDGSAVLSAEQQYKLLQSWGFGEDMIYDSSGKKITFGEDEEDETARQNAQQAGYTAAVQAFWDKADAWKDELDNLYDSYRGQQEQNLEAEIKRNEILQEIVDNQLAIEDKIYNAIIDSREAEIEQLQDERDGIEESTNRFLDGLNQQLSKERQMYQNNQNEEELNKLRRQLGILQRSGGSASNIRALQEQISEKEKDIYFNNQQQQIDAIKEASDLQLEKLDNQINIMTEQLEYQKAQGLLWAQVAQIMSENPASINAFITENGKEWQAYSTTKWNEEYRLLNGQTTQLGAYISDTDAYRTTWDGFPMMVHDAILGADEQGWHTYDEAMHDLFGTEWESTRKAAYNYYTGRYDKTADPNQTEEMPESENELIPLESDINDDYGNNNNNNKNTNNGSGSSEDQLREVFAQDGIDYDKYLAWGRGEIPYEEIFIDDPFVTEVLSEDIPETSVNNEPQTYWVESGNPEFDKKVREMIASEKNSSASKPMNNKIGLTQNEASYSQALTRGWAQDGQENIMSEEEWKKHTNNSKKKNMAGFSKGGLATYTGLAMVHGSKTKPEAFLNAEETKIWKEDILSGRKGSLTNRLIELQNAVDQMLVSSGVVNQNSENNGSNVVIERAEVNMYANIANDYDARRAGENIAEEILKIARKSSVQGVRR